MQPYQLRYIENIKSIASLRNIYDIKAPDFEGWYEIWESSKARARELRRENLEILNDYLFTMLDNLHAASAEDIAELEEFGDKLIAFSYLLDTLGLIICFFSKSIVPFVLGSAIIGASMSFNMPQCTLSIARKLPLRNVAMATSVFMAGLYVGSFFSPTVFTPIAGIFSENVGPRFLVGAAFAIAAAIVCAIIALRGSKADKTV